MGENGPSPPSFYQAEMDLFRRKAAPPARFMIRSLTMSQRIQFLMERAEKVLSARRMLHVMGVTHTAAALAAAHGLDVEAAAYAGLLHDQSKDVPPARIRADLAAAGEPIPAEDLDFPNTWHGFHGALLARTELGLEDPALLEAIRLHTTADAGVGALTEVLFIADLCEPSRGIEIAPEILCFAKKDLEDGFRKALAHKLRHVMTRKKMSLHPRAIRALQAFWAMTPEDLLRAPADVGA